MNDLGPTLGVLSAIICVCLIVSFEYLRNEDAKDRHYRYWDTSHLLLDAVRRIVRVVWVSR
jgi:hypothetical protein